MSCSWQIYVLLVIVKLFSQRYRIRFKLSISKHNCPIGNESPLSFTKGQVLFIKVSWQPYDTLSKEEKVSWKLIHLLKHTLTHVQSISFFLLADHQSTSTPCATQELQLFSLTVFGDTLSSHSIYLTLLKRCFFMGVISYKEHLCFMRQREQSLIFSWMTAIWKWKPSSLTGMCWKFNVGLWIMSPGFVTVSVIDLRRRRMYMTFEFYWPVQVTSLSVFCVPLSVMKTSYWLLTHGQLHHNKSVSLGLPDILCVCVCAWERWHGRRGSDGLEVTYDPWSSLGLIASIGRLLQKDVDG